MASGYKQVKITERIALTSKLMMLLQMTLLSFAGLAQNSSNLHFSSSEQATDVVELFTSQGCHSCPPADRFFTQLKTRDDLFEGFIPVAFHVDYWNYLGWRDRFSRSEFTFRQRQHQIDGHTKRVYTPGFVVNSKEWRGWFKRQKHWPQSRIKAGVLQAEVMSVPSNNTLSLAANFTPHQALLDTLANRPDSLTLYVTYLGMGLSTNIKRGENKGKYLQHDFVVLDMKRYASENIAHKSTTLSGETSNSQYQWRVVLPTIPDQQQQATALAMWVSPEDSIAIWQATGGYLEQ